MLNTLAKKKYYLPKYFQKITKENDIICIQMKRE